MKDLMQEAGEIVRLEGVSKSYGTAQALHPLDLSIRAGEFVTLLGPSGCGKSTTLRILGGFETPSSGRVIIDGQDVTALAPNKRNVNMVFQDYALFPHMTVRANIAFGLELKGLDRGAIKRRSDELMEFLELGPYGGRLPEQLSGGQRQRVALARALAPDPALLLLDEPLGALDAKLRGQVQAELKAIQRRTGKTFVFVTHDQDEALTMSDRIVVMNGGRVEQDGTPEELYLRPASRFVAGFLGETNLIEATVAGVDGRDVTLDWQGSKVPGRLAPGVATSAGATVTGSLRLESIRLSTAEVAGGVPVTVVGQLFKGSRVEAELETRGGQRLRVWLETGDPALAAPGPVWASWRPEALAVVGA